MFFYKEQNLKFMKKLQRQTEINMIFLSYLHFCIFASDSLNKLQFLYISNISLSCSC